MANFREEYVLRVTGGPSAGKEFILTASESTLGRAVTADISLADMIISRHHTSIYFEGDHWVVKDLESTNGTWLQGRRIKGPTPLPLATPVRLGNTLFEIDKISGETAPVASPNEPMISVRVQPMTVPKTGTQTSGIIEINRDQLKLNAICQVQSLLATTELKSLYACILEIICDVIPSDRAHLLLMDDHDVLKPVAERDIAGVVPRVSDETLSKTVINSVRERLEGVLCVDTAADVRFQSDSISGLNIRSIMCVPILGTDSLCGMIHLSVKNVDLNYAEDDLKLISAIACSAGLAIENRRLLDSNLRSERMAAVGLMAASLSHDVKNILSGLEGCVSLLRVSMDTDDSELMNEAWEMLDGNHKRMSTLMLDLLNLAREERPPLLPHDLTPIMDEVVDLVAAQTRDANITVSIGDGSRGEQPMVDLDNRGLHRVLLNLLTNAVDAVRERHQDSGKGAVEINWSFDLHARAVTIRITDNGIGIPEKEQSRVFDLFHTNKGSSGTGIGLAVSKQIIDNHRGKIDIESEAGKGTAFVIRLPITQEDVITSFLTKGALRDL
ncbi:MAG: two-component system NtrC family sensor kinase [Rhodothermales bacterium]|jgi:two-component system NtrC family sensor kinase